MVLTNRLRQSCTMSRRILYARTNIQSPWHFLEPPSFTPLNANHKPFKPSMLTYNAYIPHGELSEGGGVMATSRLAFLEQWNCEPFGKEIEWGLLLT